MTNDQLQLSARHVIGWWELRRILFNLALIVIGLLSLIAFLFLMDKAGQETDELLPAVLAYGFTANVFYTVGWVVELSERNSDPVRARENAKRNFRRGMILSCALTTAPFWLGCAFYIAHFARPR